MLFTFGFTYYSVFYSFVLWVILLFDMKWQKLYSLLVCMTLFSGIPENIYAQNNRGLMKIAKDMKVQLNGTDTLLINKLDTISKSNTIAAITPSAAVVESVVESVVEKDEYLGVNFSPMTGLFGISYYDRNSTAFFQDGFILHGFFKSSWLGYEVNYMDLQVVELDKSGLYAGLGIAWFDVKSESTNVESDIMYGFAWSSGYNFHLGPVFLGVGAHFYNFSSSRWTLNFGFKI